MLRSPSTESNISPVNETKAISLWQPWASLICFGLKQYETRSWSTTYRGKLVICSALKNNSQQRLIYQQIAQKYDLDKDWDSLPRGYAIAVCELTDCIKITKNFIQIQPQIEIDCGDWICDRYAWKLKNIQVLDNPIPVKGKQGLWDISLDPQLSNHVALERSLVSVESSTSKKLLGDKGLLEQFNQSEELLGGEEFPQHNLSSISIPCLIKQPGEAELKGVIKQDLGDCFVVYIPSSGSTVTVPKLLVYPDFSESVGQIEKSSSKTSRTSTIGQVSKSSSKINPPSTSCSFHTRRQKGEGSGHIYYRTVTRNGVEYQQAYYQWRENGQQRTKYIPKKLLDIVQEAENFKKPVTKILELLQGGSEKCSSKKFDTFSNGEVITESENLKNTDNCSSKNISPPSTRQKRPPGYGGGYIEYREVKRNHKTYSQYWYHYEFWEKGDRDLKKSRYIPKRLLARVEKLEKEKAPVREILKVLGVKDRD